MSAFSSYTWCRLRCLFAVQRTLWYLYVKPCVFLKRVILDKKGESRKNESTDVNKNDTEIYANNDREQKKCWTWENEHLLISYSASHLLCSTYYLLPFMHLTCFILSSITLTFPFNNSNNIICKLNYKGLFYSLNYLMYGPYLYALKWPLRCSIMTTKFCTGSILAYELPFKLKLA